MAGLPRIHLVFAERENKLWRKISKYCQITGWSRTLEAVNAEMENGGGEDPDLFLIDASPFLALLAQKKKAKTKEFLQMLWFLREQKGKSAFVLLLPPVVAKEHDLLAELIKMRFYNFWFTASFTEEELVEFIHTRRDLADVEKYLLLQERELNDLKDSNDFLAQRKDPLFRPYHVRSNILAFWTDNNTVLNCGFALLTALNLAKCGFRVALLETVSPVPLLAGCLGVQHPYFNTSHALSMYSLGNNDFLKNCLNQAQKHLASSYGTKDCHHLSSFPAEFYFLPDGKREDNLSPEAAAENWPHFLSAFSRFLIFEEGFHFLVFLASGRNTFNQTVLREFAYLKFLTIDMLPANVFFALQEREKGKGKIQVIGTSPLKNIQREFKGVSEKPFLYPPISFADDFLQYIYTQDYRKISGETQAFIDYLLTLSGVKVPELKVTKKSWGEKIKAYKKTIWG